MSQGSTCPWFSADLSHDDMCTSGDLYLRAYGQLRNRVVTRTSLLKLYGCLGDRQDLSIDWDIFLRNQRYSSPFPSRIECACLCLYDGKSHS